MSTTMTRKQRLRTLENRIRKNFEQFVQTGMDLKEIRDDRLFVEDGFGTWDEYLKKRVGDQFGIESSQVYRLIACAEIRPKLPAPSISSRMREKTEWTQRALLEFAPLAPKDESRHGHPRDFSKLTKAKLAPIAMAAIERAKELKLASVTASAVRYAVSAVKPKPKVAPTRDNGIDLCDYVRRSTGRIQGIRENLAPVEASQWTLLEDEHSGLVEELAVACDELAELLRSGWS